MCWPHSKCYWAPIQLEHLENIFQRPTEVAHLSNLVSLDAFEMFTTGDFPSFLWSMTALESLDISNNGFTEATMPIAIGAVTNLRELQVLSRLSLGC